MKKILALGLFFVLLTLLSAKSTLAACNFYSSMTVQTKNVTWNSTCTVSAVDGIDADISETSTSNSGILTITSPGSITINSTGKLLAGSILFSGGNVAIQNGGLVKTSSPIFIADSDADGWPANFTLFDATGSGKRRLSLMKSYSASDCNDVNDFRENNVCCVSSIWYRDVDADGYGNPSSSLLNCGQPAGYVANNTDCYDSNANAKPGSTYCGGANRGDGSFDYNCNAASSKCGTIYNYSPNLTTWTGQHGTGSCKNNNAACRSNNINYYPGATFSCGQTGAVCITQTWHEEGCGDCGESPDSRYRCTAVSTGPQGCQ